MYVLASVASAFVVSMEQLIALRALQGVAMGAGVMCARAVVRDLYAPSEGARIMSKGLTGLGVIACASAPVGGLLSEYFGFRVTLLALAVFGAIALAVVALRFEETLAQKNPHALEPLTLLRTWGQIVRHPTFWAFTLLATTSYAGLFTFLAASSFVFIGVLGPVQAGLRPGHADHVAVVHRGHLHLPPPAAAFWRAQDRRHRRCLHAHRRHHHGRAGARWRAERGGHHAALLPVHARPRRAPALRPERLGRGPFRRPPVPRLRSAVS